MGGGEAEGRGGESDRKRERRKGEVRRGEGTRAKCR